jgi:ABC-2 type transporter
MALGSGAVTVLVGVSLYHASVGAGAVLGLLVALGVAALAWTSVGILITTFIPTAESAQPLLSLSYFPVMLLSGVLGPLGLPSWLAEAMRWLPGQPTVDAASRALGSTGGGLSLPGHDLLVLGAWAAVALLASLRSFHWEPRAAR